MPATASDFAEILEARQPTITVRVDAYDSTHLAALRGYPSAVAIDALHGQTIDIPLAEFLTYGMFRWQQSGVAGWSTYDDLKAKRAHVASYFNLDALVLNGCSISAGRIGNNQPPEVTHAVGEGIGLSVVNRLHGLTEADWSKIPVGTTKDFDYAVASNGTHIIEVENKGSCVADNSRKGGAISQHRGDIEAKKSEQPRRVDRLRYGTIAALDPRRNSTAQLWLLDPMPESPEFDPRRHQLVSRLHFAAHLLSAISPRSPYAAALYNRIAAIERVRDYESLNGLRLLRSSGEPLYLERDGKHLAWFNSRSVVAGMDAGGAVFPWDEAGLFFFGMMGEVLKNAASQNFGDILEFREASRAEVHTVACYIAASHVREFNVLKGFKREKNGDVIVRLRGHLHFTSGGRVFGYLRYSTAQGQ